MRIKYSNLIKPVIYFLLFALILYVEKQMIDMQIGRSIGDEDRSGGIGFVSGLILVCIAPIYILYDLLVHSILYRLFALLFQLIFCLWSLIWFLELAKIRFDMQYKEAVTDNGLMPVSENNFYECWIICYVIMAYLIIATIVSYLRKKPWHT